MSLNLHLMVVTWQSPVLHWLRVLLNLFWMNLHCITTWLWCTQNTPWKYYDECKFYDSINISNSIEAQYHRQMRASSVIKLIKSVTQWNYRRVITIKRHIESHLFSHLLKINPVTKVMRSPILHCNKWTQMQSMNKKSGDHPLKARILDSVNWNDIL